MILKKTLLKAVQLPVQPWGQTRGQRNRSHPSREWVSGPRSTPLPVQAQCVCGLLSLEVGAESGQVWTS